MTGIGPAVLGALLMGALMTFGDWFWARFDLRHRAVFGLLHGLALCCAIGAYLGASREARDPNPFTGFDPLDNVSMHQLRDEAFNMGSFQSLPAFVARLKAREPRDAASAALFGRLALETRRMIESHVAGTEPSSPLVERLFEDLNRILRDHDPNHDPLDPPPFGASTSAAANRRRMLGRRSARVRRFAPLPESA